MNLVASSIHKEIDPLRKETDTLYPLYTLYPLHPPASQPALTTHCSPAYPAAL